MNIQEIISQIDQEIASLTKVKEALQGTPAKKSPGRPSATGAKSATKKTGRRKMSTETIARMAAAQKARWAKVKGKKG